MQDKEESKESLWRWLSPSIQPVWAFELQEALQNAFPNYNFIQEAIYPKRHQHL